MSSSRFQEFILTVALALLMAAAFVMTTFAGTWQQDLAGWRYVQDDGTYKSAGWLLDNDGSWYRFDENGYMQTGWILDNGSWYFLSNNNTNGQIYGKMVTGDNWIDTYNYYFDPVSGAMAASQIIDGGIYGENGWRIGADGSLVTQIVFLSPANVYSTGTAAGGTSTAVSHSSSGGSSGGSSRSSSGSSSGSSSRNRSSSGSAWSGYSDTSVSSTSSSFTNGNYSLMTSAQKEAVNDAIDEFRSEYITAGMSDFEKEMMIIQYIVENCEYEVGTNYSNSTTYSVLINGKAQCSGYADAFLQMAKGCGLNVRYVTSSDHAWNLIELDGDWYHVDVTWEDPRGTNNFGFGYLSNKYINLEDSEIKLIDHHNSWSPNSIKCNGYKYGPEVVEEYLRSGNVDTSLGISYEDFVSNSTVSSAEDYVEGTGGTANGCNGDVMYKIRFRYNKNGTSSTRTVIGYTYLNERMTIDYPEGYTYMGLTDDCYTVTSGSGIFTGSTLMILEADPDGEFAIEIKIDDIEDDTEDDETDTAITSYSVRRNDVDDETAAGGEDDGQDRAYSADKTDSETKAYTEAETDNENETDSSEEADPDDGADTDVETGEEDADDSAYETAEDEVNAGDDED